MKRSFWTIILALGLLLSLAGGALATSYRPYVTGRDGMAASCKELVSLAGIQALKNGGNAIDAAVTMCAMLNVVEPNMSSLGGNGMMTVYWAETGEVLSLRMTGASPKALKPEEFTPETLDRGYLAGAVPGNFGGWIAALDRFGTMSLAEVLEPAMHYAEDGFPVYPILRTYIDDNKNLFQLYPTTAKIYLPGGKVPEVGQLFYEKELAGTFRKLVAAEQTAVKQGGSRSDGLKAAFDRFYTGDLAKEFVAFYQDNDGLFTAEDFASYQPEWAEPYHTTYRGYDVYSSPSTSRGGLEVCLMLNLLEGFDVAKMGFNSPEYLHLLAQVIAIAKADVYKYVADPAFTDIPIEGLLSKEYAAERRKLINLEKAIPYPAAGKPELFQKRAYVAPAVQTAQVRPAAPGWEPDPECTTSFHVADRFGNAVGVTPTIGSIWGTGVVVGSTGVFFNNGTRVGSTCLYPDNANYLGAGKKGLLNNSPTMVLKDGKLFMSFGTPGGETIGPAQFETLVDVVDFGLNLQEALEAPRITLTAKPDFYVPGAAITVSCDRRIPESTLKALQAKGNKTAVGGLGGSMHGIMVDPKFGTFTGGADLGRDGVAIGY